MQQYYPSVVELFKIFNKSSLQMKGSNDKFSQLQCEYSLTSGEFRFQNAIFSSWTLINWNSLNLLFQDKEDTFISSCEGYSRSNTSAEELPFPWWILVAHRCHYYGRRFGSYALHTYQMVTVLPKKKKRRKKKQTQKQGLKFGKCVMVGGWVVVRPEYDVLKVFLQIRIACDTLLSDTLQRSSSAQTDGKNKWSDW